MKRYLSATGTILLAAMPAFALDVVIEDAAAVQAKAAVIIRPGGIVRPGYNDPMKPPPADLLKDAKPSALEALFEISSAGRWLQLQPKPGDRNTRGYEPLLVSGLEKAPAPAWIVVNQFPGRMGRPDNWHFVLNVFRPGAESPALIINAGNNGVMLKLITAGEKPATIMFNQPVANPELRVEPNQIKVVTLTYEQDGKSLCSVKEADFQSLRLNHAKEFAQFGRPLFEALGAESVMYPSAVEAAQLVGHLDMVSAEEVARFKGIMTRLDADSPDERDAASRDLAATGWRGLVFVNSLDKKALTVEQGLRINAFRTEIAPLSDAEIKMCRNNRDILVNAVGVDDEKLAAAAFAALEKVVGKRIDWAFKPATAERRAALEKLRELVAK